MQFNTVNNSDDLPPTAYHPSNDNFERPDTDQVNEIAQVEQYIRAAFMYDPADAMTEIRRAINYLVQYEREHVFTLPNEERLENTDDVWLQDRIEESIPKVRAALEEELSVYKRRMGWYDTMLDKLGGVLTTKRENLVEKRRGDDSIFQIRTITSDPEEPVPEGSERLSTKELHDPSTDALPPIQAFGFDTPLTAIVVYSPKTRRDNSNQEYYAFLPWFGVISCQCPFKHGKGTSTVCKHEIALMEQVAKGSFDPDGDYTLLHPQFKQLAHPDISMNYSSEVKPNYKPKRRISRSIDEITPSEPDPT